jgi:hypothetical protein
MLTTAEEKTRLENAAKAVRRAQYALRKLYACRDAKDAEGVAKYAADCIAFRGIRDALREQVETTRSNGCRKNTKRKIRALDSVILKAWKFKRILSA